ncbi:restriction endonuclease subunit S [Pseudanabaenaceae cyanobacterium LEGE 13415]|nr:restriction endonuclease subunit S [Pseudanabaenaceae cyanobacterium LEGE 13415]
MTSSIKFSSWTYERIGDHCTVGDGAHASIKRLTSGIMYLTSKNFKEGRLDLSKVDYISDTDYSKYFKENSKALTKPQADDVLFSIIGTIGEAYLFQPHDYFGISSSVSILRPDKEVIDPKYLYYWIRGHIFQSALYAIKGGVAQGYVSLEMIRSLPLNYPSLSLQRRIADILSAYDRLIENNTRRIKILEEMAQLLYGEWFVNFHFPGHERVPMVESELGLIPQGWEVAQLSDLYDTSSGGTPSRKNIEFYEGGNIRWVKTQELKDGFIFDTEEHITAIGLQRSSAKLFPKDAVLIAMYGATIGKLGILANPAATNQACCAILQKCDSFGHAYAFLYLRANRKEIFSLGMGAAQQNISQQVIKKFLLVKPKDSLMKQFNGIVYPIFELIQALQQKNRNLRQTRDLLLPKLISGEIDVETLKAPTAETLEEVEELAA